MSTGSLWEKYDISTLGVVLNLAIIDLVSTSARNSNEIPLQFILSTLLADEPLQSADNEGRQFSPFKVA